MTKKETTIKDLNKSLDLLEEVFADPENIYNHNKLVEVYHNICKVITRTKDETK